METIFPLFSSLLLPQHAWVGMCEGLPTSSAGQASRGPLRRSCVQVLGAAVTLGHGQRWPAGEPRPAAEPPLLSVRGGKVPVPPGHRGSRSGCLLGEGLSVCLSLPVTTLCIACFYWVGLRR